MPLTERSEVIPLEHLFAIVIRVYVIRSCMFFYFEALSKSANLTLSADGRAETKQPPGYKREDY